MEEEVLMNQSEAIQQLESTAAGILALVSDMGEEQARWKPAPGAWSALEVVNHLYDEEQEDFRPRLDILLHSPSEMPPPIDPAGWVTARSYNTRDLHKSMERFLEARRSSIDWLRTIQAPDWNQTGGSSRLNTLRAGDMLASWVAHDLLHLRQLIELRWQYLSGWSDPFQFEYAGEW
jgi:hypothetical protein